MKRPPLRPCPISRRTALGWTAAAPLVALAACRKAPAAPAATRVPLASLREGERVVVMRGEQPIELMRTGEEIRARSLWCTHTGCRVRWDAPSSVYRCVCHEASFDADGRVLTGPPPAPLRDLPTRIEGDQVVVDFASPTNR